MKIQNQTKTKTKRILIIEDNEDIATLVRATLQGSGFTVTNAFDGHEGFYKARYEHPDLIILDLNLPRLSGEEVCKAIREDNDHKFGSLPIIMLTGKARESDQVVGKVLGANAYLTKPFEIEELLKEVCRWVGPCC